MTKKTASTKVETPDYKMGLVKFNPAMEATAPLLNFYVTSTVSQAFKCATATDMFTIINNCYHDIEHEGKPARVLGNGKLFADITATILYHATSMAYEVQNKPIDFTLAQIKGKLNTELCSMVILWFVNEGLNKLYSGSETPNENGTIQIM